MNARSHEFRSMVELVAVLGVLSLAASGRSSAEPEANASIGKERIAAPTNPDAGKPQAPEPIKFPKLEPIPVDGKGPGMPTAPKSQAAPRLQAPPAPFESDKSLLPPAGGFRKTEFNQPNRQEEPAEPFSLKGRSDDAPGRLSELLNTHSEQLVTLEWVGPVQIRLGQPFTYEMVVRNNGSEPVIEVVVQDRLPEGMKVVSFSPTPTPPPTANQRQVAWHLGRLEPREERRIKLEMVAQQKGEVVCHATVTATTVATARFRISEPQLAIRQSCSESVMVGDPITIAISVANPGDGSAEGVVLRAVLSDGLRHEKGNDFSFDVGTLAPGETKSIQLVCATTKGGKQTIKTSATGAGGLKADSESSTLVSEPQLKLAFDGPKLRYLERQATYTIEVINPGDAPASNVQVMAVLPAGFKYLNASDGGQHDFTTRSVAWFVGTLDAGERKEVSYKCLAVQDGPQQHSATAVARRSLKAEAEVNTKVEGISALLLEVVDVDDPVEVGADTAYEIRVTNQGSQSATNIGIEAVVPPQLKISNGQGPTNHQIDGNVIRFAPLPKLAPRADAIYRVHVRGVGVGDIRFRARLVSDSLTDPVVEEESTKVYGDERPN